MPNVLAMSICCAASLVATAAAAQSATTVSPVTVQGATPQAIAKQSRAFVLSKATAPNPEIGQISRWHKPVCVQVEGLAQASQANEIKERIESVAQDVGLQAARAGCKPNVEIVFSDDAQGTMNAVAKRHEDFLGYYHRAERDRLKAVSHPIQAWYKTSTTGDGHNAGLAFAAFANPKDAVHSTPSTPQPYVPDMPGRTVGNVSIDDPDGQAPTSCGDSPHFTACLTSQFENVFIVADAKALRGKTLGLAAEYMVLLALSQPKSLDGCTPLPSILDALAKSACPDRDPPDGLTPADAAWLTALYKSDPEAKGDGEKSEIAVRMADILIKASTAAGGR